MTDSPDVSPIATGTITDSSAIPAAVQSAARWFWWIAGLSLVNTVMTQSGSDAHFVMGLGFTTVAEALLQTHKVIAFGIDAIALGVFFVLGQQAKAGRLWAFYAGIVLYALDALIYVMVQDWMSVGFHGLALFFLARGAIALIAFRQKAS